ncbi:MAG TPA: hypothetical protein VLX58_12240 [Bryobacteraceae bacterium]|nr:hypothetical protein [Bryobacteraceae bacterium]
MGRNVLVVAVLLLALAPGAHLAWYAREMPHFGHLHDDSIYWVAARSLAEGKGYRILSLPAEPFQTKYPPLWPLMLSAIWKADPRFPENLRLGMALAWAMLPAFTGLAWRWFHAAGLGSGASAALCAILALSPWPVFLSTTLMSDLIFSALLLGALLGIGRARESARWPFAAGVLASAAYLVKTAALPLIVAGPLWLALQRKYRAALAMFGAMLPAVAWWSWWSHRHMTRAHDLVSLYYTDYLGYQIHNVGWRDLPLVAWKNLDGVFSGIAGLLIFDLGATPWGMHLARVIAIGLIVGTVRLARRHGVTPYHWFAMFYVAILLVWHYPPNERFMLPVFPLLLAGLTTELKHIAAAVRKSWPRGVANRILSAGLAAGFAGLVWLGLVLDFGAISREFPHIIDQHRAVLANHRAVFSWIALHTPDRAFYAYDDAVLCLYTGRHAASLPVAPLPFYREDREAILRPFRQMPAFAREQRLDYLLLTAADFHRDLPEPMRGEVRRILERDPAFEPVYRSNLAVVYRRRNVSADCYAILNMQE